MTHLFVYGTLKKETLEHVLPQLLPYLHYVGEGFVKGRLFEVDDYPGAVPQGDGKVFGQIMALREGFESELLQVLDGYEEYDEKNASRSLFRREKVTAYFAETKTTGAWIYWYNKPVADLTEIVSGIYRKD